MAAGVLASPVSDRLTVAALLLLTFATGLVDAISVLVLGHVFVANMTGNIIFLGFWFVPGAGVDLISAIVAFVGFLTGTVIGGRLARHLGAQTRRWLTTSLGIEIVVLVAQSILAGTGVLSYHANTKLLLIVGLAMTFGVQNATARQFGVQELSTADWPAGRANAKSSATASFSLCAEVQSSVPRCHGSRWPRFLRWLPRWLRSAR